MTDYTPSDYTAAGATPAQAASVSNQEAFAKLRAEIGKVVVGQAGTVSGLLCALLAEGHVLLEGVPGVAKTLLVKSLAAAMNIEATRVQFTPDLMPSDVMGQLVYKGGEFEFRKGPIFTNILLADEINRTPPKTQAALLESMEEGQVSVDGTSHTLPSPFIVVATENPIEYEGTYPLPEAQLDRFLFKLDVDYPEESEELEVLRRHHQGMNPHNPAATIQPVMSAATLLASRAEIKKMTVDENVLRYIVSIVRATRTSPSLALGVSPRGATALLKASKAWAWLLGKSFVTPDEVKAMAAPTLKHRIRLRSELEIEGTEADQVLSTIISQVPVP